MAKETTKVKRPSSINLISILAIYGGILLFWFIYQAGIQNFGVGNTMFFGISGFIFLICGIGFWLMKKWAIYLYAILAIVTQIFLLLTERWTIMSFVIPAIVVFIGYRNLSKMS